MIRAASRWFACVAVCMQAFAEQPLPCEPSAQCALQQARDAAFKVFLTAADAKEKKYALLNITWVGQQDTKTSGAQLRERFASLRANIDALPSPAEKSAMLENLAQAMAASDLTTEAQELAAGLTPDARDLVRIEAAICHARRARLEQAFALIGQIERNEMLGRMSSGFVVNALVDAGRPDLVRGALQRSPNPDNARAITLLAMAYQLAGNHVIARAEAMRIADHKARIAALDKLLRDHRDRVPKAEALVTARLLMEEVQSTDADALWHVVDTLVDNGLYAEALKFLPRLPQRPRGRQLAQFGHKIDRPKDIRAAEKLLPTLAEEDRADVRRELLRARVATGDLQASAALELADDRVKFAEELLGAASDQFKRGHRADAQETLRVAIAAIPENRQSLFFLNDVAAMQAEIGPFADARASIDRAFHRDRGELLVILSAAQARDGLAEDAARTRAEALREFPDVDTNPNMAERLLLALNRARMPDEAERELRRIMDAGSMRMWFRHGPRFVMLEKVKGGQLSQALSLATALSQRLDDDPEPFVELYSALTGADPPSERSWPGGVTIH
jgi:tetratricopeptide (TPR) repeat protein